MSSEPQEGAANAPHQDVDSAPEHPPTTKKSIFLIWGYVIDKEWLRAMHRKYGKPDEIRINRLHILDCLAQESGYDRALLRIEHGFDFDALGHYITWDDYEKQIRADDFEVKLVLSIAFFPLTEVVGLACKLTPVGAKLKELIWRDGMKEAQWYQYAWVAEKYKERYGQLKGIQLQWHVY